MVTLFLRQGETGKQVLLSFPTTTPAEKEDVDRTLETLKSMSKTVTIQGAASEVMNLGLYLSCVDFAAEGEVERINQLAERLEHMSEADCDKFAGMLDANSISGTKGHFAVDGASGRLRHSARMQQRTFCWAVSGGVRRFSGSGRTDLTKISTDPPAFRVRPAQPEEAGVFFAQTPEQDALMGPLVTSAWISEEAERILAHMASARRREP